LHHIWVTSEKKPKEISVEDIRYILEANNILAGSDQKWEHIIWTNNKSLIPESVRYLEARGIKFREIKELDLKLGKQIEGLIEERSWGMASDVLRLEIVRCLGGIYSDCNYIFYRHPEEDIYTYDFFGVTSVGSEFSGAHVNIFGATAHHPILEEAVDFIGRRLKDIQDIISIQNLYGRYITYALAGESLTVPYCRYANKNGTVDIIYPDVINNSWDKEVLKKNLAISEKRIEGSKKLADRINKLFPVIERYLSPSCTQCLDKVAGYVNALAFIHGNEICGMKNSILERMWLLILGLNQMLRKATKKKIIKLKNRSLLTA
jgi:hypothetical protein